MALRASAELSGHEVDAGAITDTGAAAHCGVAHAAELLAFADAVVAGDDAVAMSTAREIVLDRLGAEALVDAAAVASNFQRMVRIADATGIPVDAPMALLSAETRGRLGLDAFGSAANTPAGGRPRRVLGALLEPFAAKLMARVSERMRRS